MNFFEKFLVSFMGKMPTPTNYGWFHLMFVALMIASTVLLIIFGRNAKDKTFRRLILIFWIIMLVLEIYKQIFYATIEISGDHLVWNYKWGNFPFQLCSTPLYLLPFVVFMKDGKVRDAILAFLATFALFGGLVVFIYPNDVFVSMIGVNIQTMVHHGLQIVIGIYIMVYFRRKLNFMFFVRGIIVFAVMLAIALFMDIVFYHAFIKNMGGQAFNMFYLSPYYVCHLPILNTIYTSVAYPFFLIIYIIGFVLAALIVYYIQFGFIVLARKLSIKYAKS